MLHFSKYLNPILHYRMTLAVATEQASIAFFLDLFPQSSKKFW